MIMNNNADGAMGGKTARACDNCITKRARWYCAADDAFLCQSCDGSVHSANPLARRHERVRLKTASLKNLKVELPPKEVVDSASEPTWHHGFTKKARTARHGKAPSLSMRNPVRLVPEFGGDETSNEENEEEQLLYRVPAYDPFESSSKEPEIIGFDRTGSMVSGGCIDHLHGFLPSEMDLAEFAADMETLLGKGLENESFGMEALELRDCDIRERENSMLVKLEDDDQEGIVFTMDVADDVENDTFELNSDDYNSPKTCGKEDNEKVVEFKEEVETEVKLESKKRKGVLLKLDHEAVITAWASHGRSPWTSGERPDLNLDDCWPDCLAICGGEVQNPYGGLLGGYGGHVGIGDAAGREAKVSRYREKRRTRLFSKKIRYEVRKLNAEKRPRMKGRFVKRASYGGSGPTTPNFPLLTK